LDWTGNNLAYNNPGYFMARRWETQESLLETPENERRTDHTDMKSKLAKSNKLEFVGICKC
jgi:hypothetical protein